MAQPLPCPSAGKPLSSGPAASHPPACWLQFIDSLEALDLNSFAGHKFRFFICKECLQHGHQMCEPCSTLEQLIQQWGQGWRTVVLSHLSIPSRNLSQKMLCGQERLWPLASSYKRKQCQARRGWENWHHRIVPAVPKSIRVPGKKLV